VRKVWLTLCYYVSKIGKSWMHTWGDYPPPGIAQIWLSRGYHIYQERCKVCGEIYHTAKKTPAGQCRRHLRCYLANQVEVASGAKR